LALSARKRVIPSGVEGSAGNTSPPRSHP
jgi:hypothetical protein